MMFERQTAASFTTSSQLSHTINKKQLALLVLKPLIGFDPAVELITRLLGCHVDEYVQGPAVRSDYRDVEHERPRQPLGPQMATVLLFLIISAAIFDHGFSCILILEATTASNSKRRPKLSQHSIILQHLNEHLLTCHDRSCPSQRCNG